MHGKSERTWDSFRIIRNPIERVLIIRRRSVKWCAKRRKIRKNVNRITSCRSTHAYVFYRSVGAEKRFVMRTVKGPRGMVERLVVTRHAMAELAKHWPGIWYRHYMTDLQSSARHRNNVLCFTTNPFWRCVSFNEIPLYSIPIVCKVVRIKCVRRRQLDVNERFTMTVPNSHDDIDIREWIFYNNIIVPRWLNLVTMYRVLHRDLYRVISPVRVNT